MAVRFPGCFLISTSDLFSRTLPLFSPFFRSRNKTLYWRGVFISVWIDSLYVGFSKAPTGLESIKRSTIMKHVEAFLRAGWCCCFHAGVANRASQRGDSGGWYGTQPDVYALYSGTLRAITPRLYAES